MHDRTRSTPPGRDGVLASRVIALLESAQLISVETRRAILVEALDEPLVADMTRQHMLTRHGTADPARLTPEQVDRTMARVAALRRMVRCGLKVPAPANDARRA